jgi:acyl-coenzyme A thioesterase PaaI-like protein
MEEIAYGRSVAVLQSGPKHANPLGTLHGGVLCDLTDAAMGWRLHRL